MLTDYVIADPQVIAGSLVVASTSKPGEAVPLVLGVVGGEIATNDERIIEEDPSRSKITEGREYVLFLKKFGAEPGRYSLFNMGIFEVQEGQAKALARNPDVLKGFSQAPVSELVTRVRSQTTAK